jgi:lipoprotein-releasing system permease protein
LNFLFAWRYFKSKKSTNAINIIAWISVLAITVGSAALILVLSVFNGFEGLVKGLYADFYTDIKIGAAQGKYMTLTAEQLKKIQQTAGVKSAVTIAEEKAVLVNGEYQSIIFLKGVDETFAANSKVPSHILRGKFDAGTSDEPKLILGAGIENAVGADPTKNIYPLTVYLPNRSANTFSGTDALHSYNANTSGTFMIQQDFDNKYVFTNLAFVKYMLDLGPDEYSAVEVTATNPVKTDALKKTLQQLLGSKFLVQTRYEQNQSLYSIMQMEKWVIYGILSLILVVAAFNMIGALTMLVLEKQKDIAVLKAMGASNSYIQRIFLSEGLVLAGIGAGTGISVAVLFCWLQITYKFIPLSGGTFIIDYYPVTLLWTDVVLVAVTVICIALAAAWIPSRKASLQAFSLKS